jgi:hypothetical protein
VSDPKPYTPTGEELMREWRDMIERGSEGKLKARVAELEAEVERLQRETLHSAAQCASLMQERDSALEQLRLANTEALIEAGENDDLRAERDRLRGVFDRNLNTIGRLVSALECVWMEIEEGEVRDLNTVMLRAKDTVRRIKDEERIR